MNSQPNIGNIWIIVRKLVLNAAIYCIWVEINKRLFQKVSQSWENVGGSIVKIVRLKLFSLRVRKSIVVNEVVVKWMINWKYV